MGKKDFALATKQHFILSINNLDTVSLDSLIYTFAYFPIMEIGKCGFAIIFSFFFFLKSFIYSSTTELLCTKYTEKIKLKLKLENGGPCLNNRKLK